MTQNERVKEIRKTLGLTMDKFGERVGVGKTAISNIESGNRNLTEQMTKSICREFGVREEWLRTGDGEPFGSQTRNQEIQAFANEVMSDEDESFRKRVVGALAKLDLDDWEVLERLAKNILSDEQ